MRMTGRWLAVALACALVGAERTLAQLEMGNAFTYQGQLKQSGSPANGAYDMVFKLFDTASGGNQVGPTLTFDGVGGNPPPVNVTQGLFTVSLDFGPARFNGDARWLDIEVSATTLSPRQAITPAPYALYARGTIPVQNVRDFGAVGDGASHPLSQRFATLEEAQAVYPHASSLTDEIDWAATQAALNSGAARVVIPDGDFLLGGPNTPACSLCPTEGTCAALLSVPTAVRLIEGPGTLSQKEPGPNIVKVCNSDQLTIQNLRFVGVAGTQSQTDNNGIYAVACHNLTVSGCSFENLRNHAVHVAGNPLDPDPDRSIAQRIAIVNNLCRHVAQGMRLSRCRFATIRGNVLIGSPTMMNQNVAIALDSTAAIQSPSADSVCRHVVISDNVISGYRTLQTILVHSGIDIMVTGNVIRDALWGISFNPFPGAPATDAISDIVCTDNLVVGANSLAPGADENAYGIFVGGGVGVGQLIPTGVLIANNVVDGFNVGGYYKEGGIGIGSAEEVTIRGNVVRNCYRHAIIVNNPAKRVIIAENTIENTLPTNGGAPPIAIAIAPGNPGDVTGRIDHNTIDGNLHPASQGIRFFVASNIVVGKNDITRMDDEEYYGQELATFDTPINHSGSLTIADNASSQAVNFPLPEPDANYRVSTTTTAQIGTPAAGSQQVTAIDKTATGFTVHVATAPGAGNSVNFDWILMR